VQVLPGTTLPSAHTLDDGPTKDSSDTKAPTLLGPVHLTIQSFPGTTLPTAHTLDDGTAENFSDPEAPIMPDLASSPVQTLLGSTSTECTLERAVSKEESAPSSSRHCDEDLNLHTESGDVPLHLTVKKPLPHQALKPYTTDDKDSASHPSSRS